MAKFWTDVTIRMKKLKGIDVHQAAKLMVEGTNMGMIQLHQVLNQNPEIPDEIRQQGKKILSHVDLSFSEGRRTAIIGPNGAGKTTAFNLFKQKLNDKKMHDTFVAELEKRIMAVGQEKYQEMVKAVKDMNHYYDKVSQINLQRDTLNGSAYEDIKKQLISEVDFIAKKL